MWWMESFGTLIATLTILFGFLFMIGAFVYANIVNQIRRFRNELKEKQRNLSIKKNQKLKNFDQGFEDANTMDDSISYAESKN